jgi:hypothetical protein
VIFTLSRIVSVRRPMEEDRENFVAMPQQGSANALELDPRSHEEEAGRSEAA